MINCMVYSQTPGRALESFRTIVKDIHLDTILSGARSDSEFIRSGKLLSQNMVILVTGWSQK